MLFTLFLLYAWYYALIYPRVQAEREYNMQLQKIRSYGQQIGRYSLEGWVLDHGVYDPKYQGRCKENITACVEDIKRTGHFSGVCSDFVAVFSYYYITLGFGDPVVLVVDTDEGPHAEAVFYDGQQFSVFFGLPSKGVREVHWGHEWINVQGSPTDNDKLAYEIIKATQVAPSDGQTLDDYASSLNAGRKGYVRPLHLRVGPNVVRVQGIGSPSVSGNCRLETEVKSWCPMEPVDLTITGLAPGVCRLNDWVLVVGG